MSVNIKIEHQIAGSVISVTLTIAWLLVPDRLRVTLILELGLGVMVILRSGYYHFIPGFGDGTWSRLYPQLSVEIV